MISTAHLPRIVGAFFLCAYTGVCSAESESQSSPVFYSTAEFQVTEFDLQMYLRNRPPTSGSEYGSRASVLQALSDLYALEIVSRDADRASTLSDRERQWIANYAIKMELTTRYLRDAVDAGMDATDWDSEALETYLANPEKFMTPETVTIRTLLLKTETRSESEAIEMASELAEKAQTLGGFEEMVIEFTEDEVSRGLGGLMQNVQRGQTVEPFEKAAFALENAGDVSAPVVSRFGVHLIQLIERSSAEQRPYAEVKAEIIEGLKPKRRAQYLSGLQDEARERKPAGFKEHTKALDELVLKTADGPLGPPGAVGER